MEKYTELNDGFLKYREEKLVLDEEYVEKYAKEMLREGCYFNGKYLSGENIYYYLEVIKTKGIGQVVDAAYSQNEIKKEISKVCGENNEKLRKWIYEEGENLLDSDFLINEIETDKELEKIIRSKGLCVRISKGEWERYCEGFVMLFRDGLEKVLQAKSEKEVTMFIERRLLEDFFNLKNRYDLSLHKKKEVFFKIRSILNKQSQMSKMERADIWKNGNCSFVELIDCEGKRDSETYIYWFNHFGCLFVKKEDVEKTIEAVEEVIDKMMKMIEMKFYEGKMLTKSKVLNERMYSLNKIKEYLEGMK